MDVLPLCVRVYSMCERVSRAFPAPATGWVDRFVGCAVGSFHLTFSLGGVESSMEGYFGVNSFEGRTNHEARGKFFRKSN